MDAAHAQSALETQIATLLDSNQALSRRLESLRDTFDARSTITRRIDDQSVVGADADSRTITSATQHANRSSETIVKASTLRFAFEDDLAASRVYRQAKRDACDCSFTSSAVRTDAWSIFSGLSLADLSVISIVALPLYPRDITNARHYTFGSLQAADPLAQSFPPDGIWTTPPTLLDLDGNHGVNNEATSQGAEPESNSPAWKKPTTDGEMETNPLSGPQIRPDEDDKAEQRPETTAEKEQSGDQQDDEQDNDSHSDSDDVVYRCKKCGQVRSKSFFSPFPLGSSNSMLLNHTVAGKARTGESPRLPHLCLPLPALSV